MISMQLCTTALLIAVLARDQNVLGFVTPRYFSALAFGATQSQINARLPDAFVDFSIASGSSLLSAVSPTIDPAAALSKETAFAVFIVGLIPFAIATVEFWRRIAVGASFGTADPVYFTIGEDDAPSSSRGKQVLGKGALVIAYAIFAVVAVVLGLVLFSVLTTSDASFALPSGNPV